MINITDIEDALYTWVSGVSGITTIFAKSNAPRPTVPYVTIDIIQATPLSIAEPMYTLLVDDSIDVDYSTVEDVFVSINTFYEDAYQTATKLKDSLARVTVTDALFAAGLGYLRATSVNDMDTEIDSQWERRGQFDCFFSTRSLDEENIETIQKIEITNNINDDGDTVIIESP